MSIHVTVNSRADEGTVRAAIKESVGALSSYRPTVTRDSPGTLIIETGSLKMAYVAGGLRKAEKMPVHITVTLWSSEEGTAIDILVNSRGTGGGLSGGILGVAKQKKGERFWQDQILAAIPQPVV